MSSALPSSLDPVAVSCWCGERADYADPVDPAVTPAAGTFDGDPVAFACDEHSRGGWPLDALLGVFPVTAREAQAWWEPDYVVLRIPGTSS